MAEHSRQAGVGSLYYLRDGESVAAMSRMGSNKRADIVRRQLDQANDIEKQGFLASDGLQQQQEPKRAGIARGQHTSNKPNGIPARHGVPWSAEEDSRLRTAYLAGEAITALARAHQRKRGAIASRLMKLGLVTDYTTVPSD